MDSHKYSNTKVLFRKLNPVYVPSMSEAGRASPCHERSRVVITKQKKKKCVAEFSDKLITQATLVGHEGAFSKNSKVTLHQACEEGNLNAVKSILSHHLKDINCRGYKGRTPVMVAAKRGHFEVFDYLVSKGCNVSLSDQNNSTVLHMACFGGNTSIVKKLLTDFKQDINSIGSHGLTPVMFAVRSGQTEMFEFLVGKGCNLQTVDRHYNNVLHVACRRGHAHIVQYIVKHKLVAIDSRGSHGSTAVMMGTEHGYKQIVEILKGHGADLKLVNDYKENILHVACLQNYLPMVRYILRLNIVHRDSRDKCGQTPLMIAAIFGHKEVFDYLLSQGCDCKAASSYKNNILHLVCLNGQSNMVKHIIRQNIVNTESKGYRGRTPLIATASTPHVIIFDFLVRKGCNIKAVDDDNNNILHVACLGGRLEMVRHIIRRYKVDIESKGYRGRTPLLCTARSGHIKVFRLLLKFGCDAISYDHDNNSILHLACTCGSVEMVKYIVKETKSDIEHRGYLGSTPVFNAAAHGHTGVVKYMHGKGCDMKAVDDWNNNILHIACTRGHVDMVRYLVGLRVVSVTDRNKKGYTPLDIAKKGGHSGIIDILKKRLIR